MLAIIFVTLICCSSVRAACTPSPLAKPGCKYEAENGTVVKIFDRDQCNVVECCLDHGICKNAHITKPGQASSPPSFVIPTTEEMQESNGRFLGINGPDLCLPPPFPTICNPDGRSKYVVDPPMDIPYCVRIPCSADRAEQAIYDEDWNACGSQPGCYFDAELADLRYYYGPVVLPGVPVCHLAIRTPAFHYHAQAVIKYWGTWNPYFTECTLNTFAEEIFEGQPGCKLIPLLKVFGILPKMAGWEGITSRSCWYIGGCWRYGEGCFYPVSVNDLMVKSGQRFKFNRYEIVFGRPKCQNFDPRTPYSILKSYHNCLKAGCSVDANVAYSYYNHLFAIGETMSSENQWDYWTAVENGKIGSHNLEAIIWPYKNAPKIKPPPPPRRRPPPPPPPGKPPGNNIFEVPGRFGGGGGGGGPAPPSFNSGQSKGCGHAFRRMGYPPCPPPEIPDIHADAECPYVPVNMPRFKPLKGSFRGCCEINACYLSKADIRMMHSGPSYYYTPWSFFTICSKKCGGGVKKRYRKCVSNDESKCTEPVKETVDCNNHPCGRYGHWGAWGPPCTSRCGQQSRYRSCVPHGAVCDGKDEESRKCSLFC